MSELEFENKIRSLAQEMEYPRTPDISGSVTARLRFPAHPRFMSKAAAWSLTLVLILLGSLFLIPSARAAILEYIQIGVVRIFRVEPTALVPTTSPSIPVTATPAMTPRSLLPLLESLAGEVTLQEARKKVDYPILLPSYPSDLGAPDRVFVQDEESSMTILVWLDPQKPGTIRMSLHFLPNGSWAIKKMELSSIQETQVKNQHAIWTQGPYPLVLKNGDVEITRLIEGHVLIWQSGDITYRLETDLSMEEAIKVAESLEPIR